MMLAFDRAGPSLEPLHFAADGIVPPGRPQPRQAGGDPPRAGGDCGRGDYQVGMFFDGDGDRIDIYRGDGTYLSSSFVYAAILPGDPPPVRRPGPGRVRRPQVESPGDHRDGPDGRDRGRDPQRPFADQGKPEERPSPVRRRGGIGPLLRGVLASAARDATAPRTRSTSPSSSPGPGIEDPARFDRLIAIQATTAREREWGYKFPSDQARAEALDAVREHFEGQGARSLDRMKNGMDLEATLMRRGLALRRQRAHPARRRLAPGLPAHLAERERPGPVGSRRGHGRPGGPGQAGDRGMRRGGSARGMNIRADGQVIVHGIAARQGTHECTGDRWCRICRVARGEVAGPPRPRDLGLRQPGLRPPGRGARRAG